ncbi:MAG: hypothetical protein ACREQW_03785 [Candidatus Binatia bacterium]
MDWEKIKLGLWSAVGGAVVLAIIGFNWAGWVTGGTADAMAKELAANAVAARLGSICVAQINQDSQKRNKLNQMKKQDSWDKGRFIEEQGWATMPGDEKPETGVAQVCARHFADNV